MDRKELSEYMKDFGYILMQSNADYSNLLHANPNKGINVEVRPETLEFRFGNRIGLVDIHLGWAGGLDNEEHFHKLEKQFEHYVTLCENNRYIKVKGE